MAKIDGASGYTGNYLMAIRANKMKEADIKAAHGYKDKDQVTVYTLPKGQKTKRYGSFSYKALSARAKRLQQNVYILKGQIAKTEHAAIPAKEKAKKLQHLRCQLSYASCKLNTEVENSPKVGVIVLEEDEE